MRRSVITGIIGLTLLLVVANTRAHGIGTPRVVNQPAGPYLLSAWTDPDPLRMDETHVVVGVTNAATNERRDAHFAG
jgi:hypothetical protein